MKTVPPITVVTVGSAAMAIALVLGAWFSLPQDHSLSAVLAAFGIGAGGGLVLFGPIAAMMAFGARHREWVARHYLGIQWYVSLPMMLALGYFAACIRHGIFDAITFACMALVGLGAALKIGLSDWARSHANPS